MPNRKTTFSLDSRLYDAMVAFAQRYRLKQSGIIEAAVWFLTQEMEPGEFLALMSRASAFIDNREDMDTRICDNPPDACGTGAAPPVSDGAGAASGVAVDVDGGLTRAARRRKRGAAG